MYFTQFYGYYVCYTHAKVDHCQTTLLGRENALSVLSQLLSSVYNSYMFYIAWCSLHKIQQQHHKTIILAIRTL